MSSVHRLLGSKPCLLPRPFTAAQRLQRPRLADGPGPRLLVQASELEDFQEIDTMTGEVIAGTASEAVARYSERDRL